MKKLVFLFPLLFKLSSTYAQAPKLVVGIVVDQMRYDYLYRFYDKYSEKGFKKLLNQGTSFENTNYNYIPTYTAPGHASIFTGATPSLHGIVGNYWYDKDNSSRKVYCVEDFDVQPVGTTSKSAQRSPKNMLCTTVGDQLKLFTNGKSKVVGLSLKDRGAILPAGHAADYAFWLDDSTGNFVTSSYYTEKLPDWVEKFNQQKKAEELVHQKWTLLLDKSQYTESIEDNNPYEDLFGGELSPVFPHDLTKEFEQNRYAVLKSTPFGNTLLKEFALETIKNMELGKDDVPDFLSVSFSATDYVGHQFAPHSVEIEDTYLRLDRDLGDLIEYLDKKIGKENYVLFLTADHGAAENPAYLKSMKIPAGIFYTDDMESSLNSLCYNAEFAPSSAWNEKCVQITNHQIYLWEVEDYDGNLNLIDPVYKLSREENILTYFFSRETPRNKLMQMAQNGYYAPRCGDFRYILKPNYMEHDYKGTTHGSPYSYDTHVPLLWYGASVPTQKIYRRIEITDIAITIANMLHIQEPNCTNGQPLVEILK
ncbi:MAG: alkaline phosphatase family protein [Bacteroidetes bacterium]|nr:MAG: alkaline phosphatase family protein [Bacteroidota bacterium]